MSRSPSFCHGYLFSCLPLPLQPRRPPSPPGWGCCAYPVRRGPGYCTIDDELRKLGWIEGSNLTIERRALEAATSVRLSLLPNSFGQDLI